MSKSTDVTTGEAILGIFTMGLLSLIALVSFAWFFVFPVIGILYIFGFLA